MGQMEYEQLKERYNLLGEKAKASAQGKAIAAQIAKLESTAIGQSLRTSRSQPRKENQSLCMTSRVK